MDFLETAGDGLASQKYRRGAGMPKKVGFVRFSLLFHNLYLFKSEQSSDRFARLERAADFSIVPGILSLPVSARDRVSRRDTGITEAGHQSCVI